MKLPQGSVTLLMRRAESGDQDAFDALLTRYMPRLLQLARSFHAKRYAALGGSDYANVTCVKLWCATVRGRLQAIENRENLWHLLAKMTKNEATSHARSEIAVKRGGGNVINASMLPSDTMEASTPMRNWGPVKNRRRAGAMQPSHGNAATMEACNEGDLDVDCLEVLETLPTDLKEIATLRLFGERTDEIAASIGCAERTIERKLRLIRTYLCNSLEESRPTR